MDLRKLFTELMPTEAVSFLETDGSLITDVLGSPQRSQSLAAAIVALVRNSASKDALDAPAVVRRAFDELGIREGDKDQQEDLVVYETFWFGWEKLSVLWEAGMVASGGVPWRAAWLTADSVNWSLHTSGTIPPNSVNVISIDVGQIGQGVGIATDLWRLVLTYDNPAQAEVLGLPSTIVTKITPPETPPGARVSDRFRKTFGNEFKFYTEMRDVLVEEVGVVLGKMFVKAYNIQ